MIGGPIADVDSGANAVAGTLVYGWAGAIAYAGLIMLGDRDAAVL